MKKSKFTSLLRETLTAENIPWILLLLLSQLIVYYGSLLLVGDVPRHDVTLPLDRLIPCFPPAILIYYAAFVFWGINYLLILREGAPFRRRVCLAVLIAKLLTLAVYILYPTVMVRPEVQGSGLCAALVRLTYRIDKPYNLLPSLHCLDSWMVWRGLFGCRGVSRGYKTFTLVFSVTIFVSTLLVHQHVLLDVPAGILTAELGLFLAGRIVKKQ